MTLKTDLEAAMCATRVAFKSALDDDNFDDNTLAELWRHFLGLQRIAKDYKEPENIGATGVEPASDWNVYGDGAYLAGGMAEDTFSYGGGFGQDVITFNS